jgi:hypothetical protein
MAIGQSNRNFPEHMTITLEQWQSIQQWIYDHRLWSIIIAMGILGWIGMGIEEIQKRWAKHQQKKRSNAITENDLAELEIAHNRLPAWVNANPNHPLAQQITAELLELSQQPVSAVRDYNLGMAMIKWHRYLSTLPSYKCVPDSSPTNPQLKALDKELQRIVAERPWTENTAMELGAANSRISTWVSTNPNHPLTQQILAGLTELFQKPGSEFRDYALATSAISWYRRIESLLPRNRMPGSEPPVF